MRRKIFICILGFMFLTTFGCSTNSDENNQEPIENEPVKPVFEIFLIKLPTFYRTCKDNNFMITCPVPSEVDLTSLTAEFRPNEGITVYVNGIEQINGKTPNDFSKPITYKVVNEDGESNTYTVSAYHNGYIEARLYSLSILVYNSGSGKYDLEYTCLINETTKQITVNISDKTKSELNDVTFYHVLSNNASFYVNGNKIEDGFTLNDYIDNLQVRIIAEDNYHYTDYQMTVDCIDCHY